METTVVEDVAEPQVIQLPPPAPRRLPTDAWGPEYNIAFEIIRDAKRAIEQFGWVQGNTGTRSSGFCIFGALVYACAQRFHSGPGDDSHWASGEAHVTRAMRILENYLGETAIGWNDHEGRTKKQVLALLGELSAP